MTNGIEVDVPVAEKENVVGVDKGRVRVFVLVSDPQAIALDDMIALCDIYLSLCVTLRLNPSGLLEGRLAQYHHEQAVLRSLRNGG